MRVRSVLRGLAAGALLLAGSAFAQVEATEVAEEIDFDAERTKVGLDARVGLGGMTGELGDQTGVGPLLGISAGAQPWKALGIEVGYEGQRLPLEDNLVGDGEGLYRHNVGLLAKVGPVIEDRWRPFVGAGLGMSYINISDGADDVYDDDFVREVPLAAGVDYTMGNLFAGARASYRLLYGEEFANDATIGDAEGGLFNASITLGGRF